MIENISKYVELGAYSQALKVIDSVNPELFSDETEALVPFRSRLLMGLADKYLEIGRSDQAFGILERAK